MAQRLKAQTTLVEDLGSVLITPVGQLTTTSNSGSRVSDDLFWILQATAFTCNPPPPPYIHRFKIKKIFLKKELCVNEKELNEKLCNVVLPSSLSRLLPLSPSTCLLL